MNKNRITKFILIISTLWVPMLNAGGIYKSFVVSDEVYKKYEINYKKLKVGMTKEAVINLLGKPNIKRELITKI